MCSGCSRSSASACYHRCIEACRSTSRNITPRGTWFRAAFLHTFTWLCVSFLMINPPFGDIAPPEVEHVSVLSEDGDVLLQNVSQTGRITVMIENGTDVRCHLLLSLVDNRPLGDLESMDLNLTLEGVGTYVTNEVHLQHLDTLRASSGWNSTFTRTLHPDATAVAVDLGNLSVGEYALDLNAVQQGDPGNSRSSGVGHSWSFRDDRAGAQDSDQRAPQALNSIGPSTWLPAFASRPLL